MTQEVPVPRLGVYETLLTEAIRSLAVDSGVVSSPVSAGGNALTDSTKGWASNVHKNRLVKIIRGAGAGQLKIIDGNSPDSLVIKGAWPQGIGAGAVYVILEKDLAQILRNVFGGGSDISAANPLPVDTSPGVSGYEEDSVTGATTNAWVDALDWDARELSSKTIVLANTDGVNDLDYRIYTRAYYTGQDFEEVAQITLIAGDSARIALNNHLARVTVQVIDTVGGNHADYQLDSIGRKF